MTTNIERSQRAYDALKFNLEQCNQCDGLNKFIAPDLPGHGTCCECFRKQVELEELRFSSVIFLQGDAAEEPLAILDLEGSSDLLHYLQQWDNGDCPERDIEPSWGKTDHLIIFGNYVISYNSRLPTVALTSVYHPDPTDDTDWRESGNP